MPMLMTLRIRLPVWPFHAPLRTRLEKSAILSSTACTSGTTFSPSTRIDVPAGRAQGHVQDGAVLGDVDLLAAEHGVDPRAQPGLLGQVKEELEGLVGDAVLRVIQVDAHGLGRSCARRALGSSAKSSRRCSILHLSVVGLEGFPGRAFRSSWSDAAVMSVLLSCRSAPVTSGSWRRTDAGVSGLLPQPKPAEERVGVVAGRGNLPAALSAS